MKILDEVFMDDYIKCAMLYRFHLDSSFLKDPLNPPPKLLNLDGRNIKYRLFALVYLIIVFSIYFSFYRLFNYSSWNGKMWTCIAVFLR
jgi:hypothetical protein